MKMSKQSTHKCNTDRARFGLTPLARRTFLLGTSAFALRMSGAPFASAQTIGRAQTIDGEQTVNSALHALPHRQGDGSGGDWANAIPFNRVTAVMAQHAPQQEVFLGITDAFPSPMPWSGQQVLLNTGGTADAPITIRIGRADGIAAIEQPTSYVDPPLFQMIGQDTAPGERPDVGGAPFLVLGQNASHLRLSGPVFDRAGGNGFYNLDADGLLTDLAFSDIYSRNVGRVIETERGTSVDGLLVERCSVLGAIRGFARFHSLTQAEFRDLDLDANLMDGGGGAVCQLISIVAGQDLNFCNIRLAQAINIIGAQERGSTYIQGDGLVLEEETHGVRVDNCHAEDMGDGGFDLKSEGVHMTDCTATRCKLGIRIWSHHPDNLLERCRVTEPVTRPRNEGSCLWLGGTLTARDCEFHAEGEMSPIRFGEGNDGGREADLRIEGGVISHTPGVSLTTGAPGTIELENVLVNGVETSGRYYWTGRRMRQRWL